MKREVNFNIGKKICKLHKGYFLETLTLQRETSQRLFFYQNRLDGLSPGERTDETPLNKNIFNNNFPNNKSRVYKKPMPKIRYDLDGHIDILSIRK